jgi:hypothetical protein
MNAYYIVRLLKEMEQRAGLKDLRTGFSGKDLEAFQSGTADYPFGSSIAKTLWGADDYYWKKHWSGDQSRQCLRYYDLLAKHLGAGDLIGFTERHPWEAFRQIHRLRLPALDLPLEEAGHYKNLRLRHRPWFEAVVEALTAEFKSPKTFEALYAEFAQFQLYDRWQLQRLQRMILEEQPSVMLMAEVKRRQTPFAVRESVHEIAVEGRDLRQRIVLSGYNPFAEPADHYILSVEGDTAVRWEELDLKALLFSLEGQRQERTLEWVCRESGRSKSFKIELYFLPAFRPGESFELELNWCQRGTMRESGKDYVGTSLSFSGEVSAHRTVLRFPGLASERLPRQVVPVRYDTEEREGRLYFNASEEGFVYVPEVRQLNRLRVRFDYELPR